jgi:hypothetical protein
MRSATYRPTTFMKITTRNLMESARSSDDYEGDSGSLFGRPRKREHLRDCEGGGRRA